MTPQIQSDDTVLIGSDARATRDALQVQIVRTQAVPVWTGSLQSIDRDLASLDAELIDLEQNHESNVAAVRAKIAALNDFKAQVQTEIDSQKPAFMPDPVPADTVGDVASSTRSIL